MTIKTHYMKNNPCYINARVTDKQGIMLHTTGATNKFLSRYVAPDDGTIGKNKYNNDWNRTTLNGEPLGLAVHGFIGESKMGDVLAYNVIPYEYETWNCGGSGNQTHISWEICEGNPTDKVYFDKAWNVAVTAFAEICIQYGWGINRITSHVEGYKRGIASNHGDPNIYFSHFGKTMRDFRLAVKDKINTIKKDAEKAHEQSLGEIGSEICHHMLLSFYTSKTGKNDTIENVCKWLMTNGYISNVEYWVSDNPKRFDWYMNIFSKMI